MAKNTGVSLAVIRRLPRYYRFLEDLRKEGIEYISSRKFAELIGVTASQVRQDLNCFGGFGQQGRGYDVANLCKEIETILGIRRQTPAVLVGAGNLGAAIANHMDFSQRGFSLLGIFDTDARKIGQTIGKQTILDMQTLGEFCQKHHPQMAILCIPQEGAEKIVPSLIEWGIEGFWNFSHFNLAVSYENVIVENVHLGDSLLTLSYLIQERDQQKT